MLLEFSNQFRAFSGWANVNGAGPASSEAPGGQGICFFRRLQRDPKGDARLRARGDKRRTIQMQNGLVVDHVRNRRTDVKSYMKGDLDWLA